MAVAVGPGNIQTAVNAIPASLGAGDYCLQLAAGTYNEQVTIQGKTFASPADRIIISSDVGAPVIIRPPALSTAAFHVLNDSVTIMGLTILPNFSVPYGILASSANVLISSVSVDGNNLITSVGIQVSSNAVMFLSSVTVQSAAGIVIDGFGASVVNSSATAGAVAALLFNGGSASGTVTGSFFAGGPVALFFGANNHTFNFSTMTSTSGQGLLLSGASSNTFNGCYIAGSGGNPGVTLNVSHSNTINQSTITGNSGGGFGGVHVQGSSSNTISGSFITNTAGIGVSLLDSRSNTIRQSRVVSAAASPALWVSLSSFNVITQSFLVNTGGGPGVMLLASTTNTISFSTITASVAAVYQALQLTGSSSNTISNSYIQNLLGAPAYITGSSNFNTIRFSTVVTNAAAAAALTVSDSSTNTITQSRLSSASGFGAWIVSGASYTAISQTTMVGNSAANGGLYLDSPFCQVTDSLMSNPSGYGAYITTNAIGSAISLSTMSNSSAFAALLMAGVSSVTVSQSVILNTGGVGAFLFNATSNTIGSSALSTQGANSSALQLLNSSANVVTQSFLSAGAAYAASLTGSYGNTISFSTMSSIGAGQTFLASGSTLTMISQCAVSNAIGAGAQFQLGSILNSVSQSTITSGGTFVALRFATGVSWNTVTRSRLFSPLGNAFELTTKSNFNTITFSTIASGGVATQAVWFNDVASNTLASSYIQASTAVLVTNATGTFINANHISATGIVGHGVGVNGAGFGLSMSSNTITGGRGALFIASGDRGRFIISTNTFQNGAVYGIAVGALASGAEVWITSNTVVAPTGGGVNDAYGILLNALTTGATIQNNLIVVRSAGTTTPKTAFGILAQNSSGLLIDHNRISAFGTVTGAYEAIRFEGTGNSQIVFNDVLVSGGGLTGAFALNLNNASQGVQVKNNAFSFTAAGSGGLSTGTVRVDATSQTGFQSDYNVLFSSNVTNSAVWGAAHLRLLDGWRTLTGQDLHSFTANPKWSNPAAEDFHPQSQAGRWDPVGLTFVVDPQTSLTIDRADPGQSFANEPPLAGGRANIGSFGNTAEASKSAGISATPCVDGFNVKLDGSLDFKSIQQAVGSVPTPLTASFCVVVRDTETYSEAVTVVGLNAANNQLFIQSDPTFVSSAPVLSPPVGSSQALLVAAGSVTVSGLDIRTPSAVLYGLRVSSPSVTLSRVHVNGLGNVSVANISVTSGAIVVNSSVTAGTAVGLEVFGSGVQVGLSTMSAFFGTPAIKMSAATSLTATGPLWIFGDFLGVTGLFQAGAFTHTLTGDFQIGAGAGFSAQTSTISLQGPGPVQTLSSPSLLTFNGIIVQSLSQTNFSDVGGANIAVLTDTVAGSTVAFAAGSSYVISDLQLRGAPGSGLINLRSLTPGSAWSLGLPAASSVTSVSVRDSTCLSVVCHANDGTSLAGTGNTSWNFNPSLMTLAPGETFTEGVGRGGAPSPRTAGVAFPLTVKAFSSNFNSVPSAPVGGALAWNEVNVSTPASQPLVAGATLFSNVVLRTAQSAVVSPQGGAGVFSITGSTVTVNPATMDRLQIIMPGEVPAPGSVLGRYGSVSNIVTGGTFQAQVRGTDPFWNLVSNTDLVRLTTAAPQGSNLPQTTNLAAGATTFTNVVMTASATARTLTATDITNGAITAHTGSAYTTYSASLSSPSLTIAIPAGSIRSTLGGAIMGTASDLISVTKVQLALKQYLPGGGAVSFFNWTSGNFGGGSPIFGNAVVTPFNGPAVNWAMALGDSPPLTSGASYYIIAIASNPSNNSVVVETTFTFNSGGLTSGAVGDGQGSAAILTNATAGCQVILSTLVFTAGPLGISTGGLVAVHVPNGWSRPQGFQSPPLNPPTISGFLNIASTRAFAPLFNPTQLGNATLGENWVVYQANQSLAAGHKVFFTFLGFPATGPQAQGPQVFLVQTQAGPGGNLTPIANSPSLTLTAGPPSRLVFSPQDPLSLGLLQTSATMQLSVTDNCGVSTVAVGGVIAASLSAGQFGGLPDPTALFYQAGGGLLASQQATIGLNQSSSQGFYLVTSTVGVAFENIIATATFPNGPQPIAGRFLRLLPNAIAISSVSIDTGTLSVGAQTATMTANGFTAPAFVNFKLSDPGLRWEVIASTSPSTFYPEVLHRHGYGDPGRNLSWNGINERVYPNQFVAPGVYYIKVSVEGGAVVDQTLRLYMPQTASIYGSVRSTGAYAQVNVFGPGANYGNFAVASSSGFFQIYGLQAGQRYNIQATTSTFALGQFLQLSVSSNNVAAAIGGVDIGSIPFPTPSFLRLSATLPTTAPREFWGNVYAHTADYAETGFGTLHFSSAASSSDDGAQGFGRNASTWTILGLTPGTYDLDLNLYAVGISTKIQGVVVAAGSVTDLPLSLEKKTNLYGWAVLPSTTPFGSWVSIEATQQGDQTPSLFGGAFVPCPSCQSFTINPTSGVFSLFGLDAGTWTLKARSEGFLSVSSSVLVAAGGADIGSFQAGGFDLTLSSGGVIRGTVTVTGDSSQAKNFTPGAPGFTLFINAFNPVTLAQSSLRLQLSTSSTLTSSTFSLSGLENGTYLLKTRLEGFTEGSTTAVVTAGAGAGSMTLKANDAHINLTAKLPGGPHPPSAFAKVAVTFRGPGLASMVQDMTVQGTTVQYFLSSATAQSPGLDTGFYSFDMLYAPTGMFVSIAAPLTHGATAAVLVDLSGSTFTVSGKVNLTGAVSFSSANYSVTVSSISGLLANVSTTSYCLMGGSVTVPSFHLQLLPITAGGQGGAGYWTEPLVPVSGSCFAMTAVSGTFPQSARGARTPNPFLAYVAPIAADGSFQFPNVAPGTYVLRNNAELDNNTGDGDELPRLSQIVNVSSNTAGLVFKIDSGFSLSGSLILPPQVNASRAFAVTLLDSQATPVRSTVVNFSNANRASYLLSKVAEGNYTLRVDDLGFPKSYGARPRTVKVQGADATGLDVALSATGLIKGKLSVQQNRPDGTRQFVLVTSQNKNLLPKGFTINATANPWFQGGFVSARGDQCGPQGCGNVRLEDDQFIIDGVLPGSYDVRFLSRNGASDTEQGGLNLVSSFLPGVDVSEGRISDVGTVNLVASSELRGKVYDTATSTPLANISITARASNKRDNGIGGFPSASTDKNGEFVLGGLDPVTRFYDLFVNGRDEKGGTTPAPYEQKVSPSVDVTSAVALTFYLPPAPYSVSGRISTPPGGPPLGVPFSESGRRQPGAVVFFQKTSEIPIKNPLADIEVVTDRNGAFTIPSLATGTYKLTAASLDYGSLSRIVSLTTGSVDLGTLTLSLGATLSGSIRKPDGSNPSFDEVHDVIGATNDLSEILFATLSKDANTRTVTGYTISGFRTGVTYRLLLINQADDLRAPDEARSIIFSTTTESRTLDLLYRPAAPFVLSKARKSGSNFLLSFQMSAPLRAKTANDDDLTRLLSTVTARGTLSLFELSPNRTKLTALYTPPVLAESSFSIRMQGYSQLTDPDSLDPLNPEFLLSSTVTFFSGIDGLQRSNIANFSGGNLLVEGDAGRITLPSGVFQVDSSSSVEVTLQISGETLAKALSSGMMSAAEAVSANLGALRYAPAAYPPDILRAMAATPPQVSPFSGFYDVLLPLGIRTALARPVQMTISYSTGTDPTTLNLYWYNAAANAYILQQDVTGAKPVIDTVKRTITINVNHFSTFVLFQTGVAVITGNVFAGGDMKAYNFPNPFDLSTKMVSTIHGGGTPTIRGTLISISLPSDVSGDGSIRIFNVAGEKVRTIGLGAVAGGKTYYQPWDGRNDSGRDVASGVYIGQLKVGGRSVFFKMALIK